MVSTVSVAPEVPAAPQALPETVEMAAPVTIRLVTAAMAAQAAMLALRAREAPAAR
jgi:hypothetical protein